MGQATAVQAPRGEPIRFRSPLTLHARVRVEPPRAHALRFAPLSRRDCRRLGQSKTWRLRREATLPCRGFGRPCDAAHRGQPSMPASRVELKHFVTRENEEPSRMRPDFLVPLHSDFGTFVTPRVHALAHEGRKRAARNLLDAFVDVAEQTLVRSSAPTPVLQLAKMNRHQHLHALNGSSPEREPRARRRQAGSRRERGAPKEAASADVPTLPANWADRGSLYFPVQQGQGQSGHPPQQDFQRKLLHSLTCCDELVVLVGCRLVVVTSDVVQPCHWRLVVEAAVWSAVVVAVEVERQHRGPLG